MNKKEILKGIKNLLTLSKTDDFIQVEVGVYTIEVSSLEVGQVISIVTEDGNIPASSDLDGIHTIVDTQITVKDGVITDVKEVKVESEVEVEANAEAFKSTDETDTENVKLDAELESMVLSLGEKVTALESKLSELLSKLDGYESTMTEYYSKTDTLWTGTPAQKKTEDFKAETSKVLSKPSNLDEFRAIRRKK